MKTRKTGINKPIICKNCGHRVGVLRMKRKLKWRTIWWGIGIAFTFELVANTIVYLIFTYGHA